MHFGNSGAVAVVLLLLFVVCCRVCVSVQAHAHAHADRNAKAQTGATFFGLPENDVQVVWSSKSRDALRRNIRSPVEEEGAEGSGGGFGLVLADEDGGSAIGGVNEGDEGSGRGSGTGSGDGNNEPESPESEDIYIRHWATINCSDPLHMQLLNSTGGGGNLPPNYNKFELPKQTLGGEPEDQKVWVWLQTGIQSIADIDETKGEITLEMDVLIGWWDDVLFLYALRRQKCSGGNYSDVFEEQQKVLDHSFLDSIWKPDIFIDNLVSVKRPQLLVPPTGLKFSPNGRMTYTTRVKIKIECDFNFGFYPADTQKCDVVFRSYSHNASALVLVWHDPVAGAYLFDLSNDNFDVAIGSLERYRLVAGGRLDKTNNTFDCLQFTVSARRRLSYHLIQTYVPSMLYIDITWLCFMVPRRMIEARMAIVMTTLLSLTAMFSSVRESTPIVSYTKAIDVWMVACIVFVFAVLLQFSLLLWTETRKDEAEAEEKRAGVQHDAENSNSKEGRRRAKKPPPAPSGFEQRFLNAALEKSSMGVEFIEAHSFFLVLCVFIVFNILYWSSLLYMSGYYEWRVDSRNNAVDSPADNFTVKYPYP